MLGRLFERSLQPPPWGYLTDSDHFGLWPGDDGYGYGGSTNPLQLLTVSACVRFISNQIKNLPIDVYRIVNGERVEVAKPMWLDEPVPGLSFADWCGQVLASLLLDGNAYVLIVRGESGSIVYLQVLDPASVTLIGGRYFINGRGGAELMHLKGMMLPGATVGCNPVAWARQTIDLGMSALQYGKGFFDRGDGNMPGVIEIPKIAQPGTKEDLAKQWKRKRQTGGRGLPGVLDDGATWKPTTISNEDAQFLDTQNYTRAQIAGELFFVDPSELGIPIEGTSLEYKTLLDLKTRRVEVTFIPWMIPIEWGISQLLAAPRYMKFNVDGLKRADQKVRYEGYEIGLRAGFLTVNECRAKEDLPPLPGGDVATPAPIGGVDVAA